MDRLHVSVLLEEVRHFMQPVKNGVYVDGTLGHGGHANILLSDVRPDGVVLGIERDRRNLKVAQKQAHKAGDRARYVLGDYRNLTTILHENNIDTVDGVLLDLGFSSAHVDEPERGFSFQSEGPLDMRYDTQGELTAAKVVNSWPESKLADSIFLYGEEKRSRHIAKGIVTRRRKEKFKTTTDLANCIADTLGRRGKTHPATRTFQALRIIVNDELAALEEVLPQIVEVLKPGGRVVIISFHSLEDRIVKQFFKASKELDVLTKKPVTASEDEIKKNPRARSAKLRAATKTKAHYVESSTTTTTPRRGNG